MLVSGDEPKILVWPWILRMFLHFFVNRRIKLHKPNAVRAFRFKWPVALPEFTKTCFLLPVSTGSNATGIGWGLPVARITTSSGPCYCRLTCSFKTWKLPCCYRPTVWRSALLDCHCFKNTLTKSWVFWVQASQNLLVNQRCVAEAQVWLFKQLHCRVQSQTQVSSILPNTWDVWLTVCVEQLHSCHAVQFTRLKRSIWPPVPSSAVCWKLRMGWKLGEELWQENGKEQNFRMVLASLVQFLLSLHIVK